MRQMNKRTNPRILHLEVESNQYVERVRIPRHVVREAIRKFYAKQADKA